MGAIFGFTGPPDPRLAAHLGRSLAHRGRRAATTTELSGATLGHVPLRGAAESARVGAGLASSEGDARDEGVALALAGYLLDRDALASTSARALDGLATRLGARGAAGLEGLRGGFALAFVRDDALHLTRDALGLRTLYWTRHADRVVFASEPKALWTLPGFSRAVSPRALARYLSFSFSPGEETMLTGLFELEPGTLLRFRGDAEPERTRWFDAEGAPGVSGEDAPPDEWARRFRDAHARAVAERLELSGASHATATLSGGIDSSVVVAELARRTSVRTVALHFGEAYPNELEHARAVADRCGTRHEELLVEPRDFLARLRRIVWHLDDPIGDPVTVPNFEVAERLGGDTEWLFNGEGGDPLFGGPKNLAMLLHQSYGGLERTRGWRERAYLASYRRAYEALEWLLTPEWRAALDPREDLEAVLTPYFEREHPPTFIDRLMLTNQRLKGAHLILPKVERMQAAAGITPLAPLFDERVAALSFEMPATMKVARGVEKVVLKRAYADDLPASILGRPKSGMRVPVHFWFQGELERYARKVLGRREVRRAGIFDERAISELLAYRSERRGARFGIRLWMLLTFEIWRRIVIEGEAP